MGFSPEQCVDALIGYELALAEIHEQALDGVLLMDDHFLFGEDGICEYLIDDWQQIGEVFGEGVEGYDGEVVAGIDAQVGAVKLQGLIYLVSVALAGAVL